MENDIITDDSSGLISGTDHITLEGSNTEETVDFYGNVLGMELITNQPNLDRTELDHLFFDTGDGRVLTFFTSDNRTVRNELGIDIGDVHHLAFSVADGKLSDIRKSLAENGYEYSEYDRNIFYSLYTEDPNGLTIELVVNKHNIPHDKRGDVYSLAHKYRVEDGDEYIKDRHVKLAKEECGIDTPSEDPKN